MYCKAFFNQLRILGYKGSEAATIHLKENNILWHTWAEIHCSLLLKSRSREIWHCSRRHSARPLLAEKRDKVTSLLYSFCSGLFWKADKGKVMIATFLWRWASFLQHYKIIWRLRSITENGCMLWNSHHGGNIFPKLWFLWCGEHSVTQKCRLRSLCCIIWSSNQTSLICSSCETGTFKSYHTEQSSSICLGCFSAGRIFIEIPKQK